MNINFANAAYTIAAGHRFGVQVSIANPQNNAHRIYFNGTTTADMGEVLDYVTHFEVESLPTSGGAWGYLHYPIMSRQARTYGKDVIGMTGRFHKSWADFGGLKTRAQLGLGKVYESLCMPDKAFEYYEKVAKHEKDSAIGKAAAADAKRMKMGKEHVKYMHCLPCERAMEVADEVMDNPKWAAVWTEAENRLHGQKAIMALIMQPTGLP